MNIKVLRQRGSPIGLVEPPGWSIMVSELHIKLNMDNNRAQDAMHQNGDGLHGSIKIAQHATPRIMLLAHGCLAGSRGANGWGGLG